MNKIQKIAVVVAAGLSLTGCVEYKTNEVVEVEEGVVYEGPILELEVNRNPSKGAANETYEAHVRLDSGCAVRDIYNPETGTCS